MSLRGRYRSTHDWVMVCCIECGKVYDIRRGMDLTCPHCYYSWLAEECPEISNWFETKSYAYKMTKCWHPEALPFAWHELGLPYPGPPTPRQKQSP